MWYENILEVIGNTPLVRLKRVVRGIRPTMLAKLEYLNPGGSVKDRIGIAMLEAAEKAGRIRPGGTVIEGTSGNTGMGLALAAAIKATIPSTRCPIRCARKKSTRCAPWAPR
jgi:cystathionine beta-synthase